MDAKFLGKWKLVKTENVSEYMKALDVSFMLRKMVGNLSFSLEFENEGDTCHITMLNTIRDKKTSFKLNEPFRDTDMPGKTHMVTYSQEDGRLKAIRKPAKEGVPAALYDYYINDKGQLIWVLTITSVEPNVSCTRYLERV